MSTQRLTAADVVRKCNNSCLVFFSREKKDHVFTCMVNIDFNLERIRESIQSALDQNFLAGQESERKAREEGGAKVPTERVTAEVALAWLSSVGVCDTIPSRINLSSPTPLHIMQGIIDAVRKEEREAAKRDGGTRAELVELWNARWNPSWIDGKLLVCKGNHHESADCEYQEATSAELAEYQRRFPADPIRDAHG